MADEGLFEKFAKVPAVPRSADEHEDHGLQTYRLKFFEEGMRPGKDIEFEAADAYRALVIAHEEARRRSAELWRNGKRLCSITRRNGSFWEIRSTDAELRTS